MKLNLLESSITHRLNNNDFTICIDYSILNIHKEIEDTRQMIEILSKPDGQFFALTNSSGCVVGVEYAFLAVTHSQVSSTHSSLNGES